MKSRDLRINGTLSKFLYLYIKILRILELRRIFILEKLSLWFSKETNSIRLISEIATYKAVEKAFKLFLSLMENQRQLKVLNADVIHRDGLLRHNDKKTY